MGPLLLTDIEAAVRSSWGADTTTPAHRADWDPANPARDQCGVTALVVHDLLGGELIRARSWSTASASIFTGGTGWAGPRRWI